MKKYEIIKSNDDGRKRTVRFLQYLYNEKLNGSKWTIADHGCGAISLATILATLGFKEDPISISNLMLFDESGILSSGYYNGICGTSLIYCLNRLINEKKLPISFEIVKINYNKPSNQKDKIFNMLNAGYMAIVNMGPHKTIFCEGGHYMVITSVSNNGEFYICNGLHEGDNQIDKTFSYEEIVKNLYIDNFDFLMIKKNN